MNHKSVSNYFGNKVDVKSSGMERKNYNSFSVGRLKESLIKE
jgi:hypothetical protein